MASVRCGGAMVFHPMTIAAFGLIMAVLSGMASIVAGTPFLMGLWWFPEFLGGDVGISTPLFFDIGVYLVVVGAVSSIALALEESDDA